MKRCLVTITDNIAPTSMPYNEFALYRCKHEPDEKQVVILLFKESVSDQVTVPESIELHTVNRNIQKLRGIVERIVNQSKNDNTKVVFHIHEAKSVLLFNLATDYKYKNQIVYTLHSTYKNYPFHNKLFSQLASRQCGQVVCVSKTSYKYYPARLKNKLGDRVCYITNGVDVERIDKAISVNNESAVFTLIYIARLVELKRHLLLIDAIKSIPNIRLKLVGTGPLEGMIREQSQGLQVIFDGVLSRDEVYAELKGADAYVSASSYEGLPISVLEAMRCGLPCILSDIEQHREIKEKCSGIILCRDDMWKESLQFLTNMNSQELQSIGIKNAEDVERFFSLSIMHKKYDSIFSKLEG